MYLYRLVYRLACVYQNASNKVKHVVYDPMRRVRNYVLTGNAIERAVAYDGLGNARLVYQYGYFDLFYHLFLMWCVFGWETWNEKYRDSLLVFKVDGNLKHDELLYVRLANGREFLRRDPFDAHDVSLFEQIPKSKYLCIMIGGCNMTRFYKRFACSWNSLRLRVIDIAVLALRLDAYAPLDIVSPSTKLVTIDDDSFEEKVYTSEAVPVF